MHTSCKNAIEELDALLFSGDLSEQDITELKDFLTRWKRQIKEHEDIHALLAADSNDTVHARIKKFNQLITPQLLELDEREQELATMFLIGYLKGHISVSEIEEISDALGTFIERDLG